MQNHKRTERLGGRRRRRKRLLRAGWRSPAEIARELGVSPAPAG